MLIEVGNVQGMQVITDTFTSLDSVVIAIWVKAGSRVESVHNSGIAHFLEHMAFKGTDKRSAEDIAREFGDLGGYFNACTGQEFTLYYVKVLKEDFRKAVEILADVILNSVFSASEIEKEREVILQEIAQTNDCPQTIIFDYLLKVAFPDQALGRPILGEAKLIKSFAKTDFLSFIEQNYFSENILFIASGNIKHEEVIQVVSDLFSSISNTKTKIVFPPSQYQGGDYREWRALEQAHVLMGWKSLDYYQANRFIAKVFAIILGGGMSSRLFQEVREKRGLVYSIMADNESFMDNGLFNIYACATPDKMEELFAVIFAEIRKICEHFISIEELERAKMQIKASLLMQMESNFARANHIGTCISRYNKLITKEEIIQNIANVSIKDINDFANTLFVNQKITLASIGEIKNIPNYERVQALLESECL